MIGLSSDRVVNENPRPGHPYWSPKNRRPTNVPYWTKNGLSRPNCSRTRATSSGVGCLPAKVTAGSVDGMTKKMAYVMSATSSSVTTTHSSRRTM